MKTKTIRIMSLVVLVAALVVPVSASQSLTVTRSGPASEPNALFREVQPDVAAMLQPAVLSLDEHTMRRRYAELNPDAITSDRAVVLNLFHDVTVTVDGSKFERLEDGTWQLAALLPSTTWGQVTMGISGGMVHGTVHLDRRVYELRSIRPDVVAIEEVDLTEAIAPDTPPEPDTPPAPEPPAGERRLAPLSSDPVTHAAAVPNLTVLVLNSPVLCMLPGQAASQAANFKPT